MVGSDIRCMPDPVFSQSGAEVYVPDDVAVEEAFKRTTHLAIGAHADDLEFFAWHGIAACFARDDRWFTGVVLTDGAGSPRSGPYGDWSAEKLVAARRAEQRAAAVVGEYSAVVQLMHPSKALRDPANATPVEELVHLLRNMKPEVVYLHNPADAHDTHVAAYLRSIAALRRLPPENRPSRVFGCEVWRGLDWLVPEDKVALSAGERRHLQAALAGVFDTQIAGGKRYDLAVLGRRTANATFHESHHADRDAGLTFAVDLTSLLVDHGADPEEFAIDLVRRLETDVRQRLRRVGGAR